jgi:hypothetical protein
MQLASWVSDPEMNEQRTLIRYRRSRIVCAPVFMPVLATLLHPSAIGIVRKHSIYTCSICHVSERGDGHHLFGLGWYSGCRDVTQL